MEDPEVHGSVCVNSEVLEILEEREHVQKF